jgi:hypothetical protein
MRASLRVLGIGAVVVTAVSGIAFAQKPYIPIQPVSPLSPAAPPLPANVFKSLRPLSPTQKLALVKPPKGAAPTERDLDAPIRLGVRTPYIDANTYLTAYGNLGYNPFFEPPELHIRGSDPGTFAALHFRAAPERTYLVDCPVKGNGATATARYASEIDIMPATTPPGTGPAFSGPTTTASAAEPPDDHLTFVIRKDSAARDVRVRIRWSGSNFFLGTCEITPVRGL